ncbi:MAG: ABC transporter permease [Candidatus Nealsonbacteria bacterium]
MGKAKEYFKIALRNLKTRQIRSWLTILGIVIGVFLIVSLLSLSEGLKTAVLQQLNMMGKDLIMIMPGEINDFMTTTIGGVELTDDDIKAIEKTYGVDFVVPMTYKAEVMRYGGEKKTVLVYGNNWKDALKIYQEDMGWSLNKGRWPVPGKSEVVVGSLVPEDIFVDLEIGGITVINGRKFEVVGILNSLGSKQDDMMIGMDLDVFRSVTGEQDGAKMAFAKVKPGFETDRVVEDIKENLERNKKRKNREDLASYTVLSSEKITDIVGNVMALIQLVIFGFASIAIIVGGIGIMNTMYTSVHERIKEIGILKAIGARNSTIVQLFLMEAGIFGMIGGIGGTLLGLILAKSVEFYGQIHPMFYMSASVSPGLILFALSFSFLVGGVAGFFPSRSAAKLKPVDALRYE